MKLFIGIVVVIVSIYILVDLDILSTSDLATVRDYIQEKGSQLKGWLLE